MKRAGLADSPFFSSPQQQEEETNSSPPTKVPAQDYSGNDDSRSGLAQSTEKDTAEISTRESTRTLEPPREKPSDKSREKPRSMSPGNPTRDEIQEFSFSLRDELKVKVQAEVPHSWQKELAEMARKMDVKKLELYRFILGEFLGKVQRKGIPK
ncbi:MAG TPA: hypothetical protein VMW64_10695 [Dehalococcoidia bacterium]|nr:hypothetical protein [Dehalococcoidia bacterium]